MALTTFNPSVKPSPGTSIGYKPRLLKAEFGEGYTQTAQDGINHLDRDLSLRWEALTPAQADEINDFLSARGGSEPFWYQPRNGVLMRWTCEEWDDRIAPDGVRQIDAVFLRSNTLET